MGSQFRPSTIFLPLFVLALAPLAEVPGSDTDTTVQAALQAEVDGDATQRETLLVDAVRREPDHTAARWHSGHVRVDDQWLPVQQAEQSVTEKGEVTAYRKLRDQAAGSLAAQISLARWCRKNGLADQQRLHWFTVLGMDPTNKEARTRLGVREFRGRLLTAEQIQEWKQGMEEYRIALDHWSPILNRWRREIESSTLPHLTEAWDQLTSLDEADAVPSLQKMFHKADHQLRLKIVSVLGNIQDQIATDSLVQLSLYADSPEIRQAAATELSDRSLFGFVPQLLSQLEAPVELRYYINTLGSSGIHSEIRFSQENASAHVNVAQSYVSNVPIRIRSDSHPRAILAGMLRQQQRLANQASLQYRRIRESLQSAQVKNARTNMFNQRIFAALVTSTGQQIEYRPQYWWDWWKDYNELDDSTEKPDLVFRRSHRYYISINVQGLSCFAAGTPVWTDAGAVEIEDVQRGDRVLSQDPESGELTYRLVLDTTVRPPSETLRIQVGDEQIVATLGHPIWVVGSGWKMAKQLSVGDQLHGVSGGVSIEQIEPGPTQEAHNLVVHDTNTYFVGQHRLLVHDNMPRRATVIPVPGWLASAD